MEQNEYRPLTEQDAGAYRVYMEGVAAADAGRVGDSIRLMKRASGMSRSVAYHFNLLS